MYQLVFKQISTISSSGCVNFVISSSCRKEGGNETVKIFKKLRKGGRKGHMISASDFFPRSALVNIDFLTGTTRNNGEYFTTYRVLRCVVFHSRSPRDALFYPDKPDTT